MVNEGMHYLNAKQEALLRSHLAAGTLLQTLRDTCDSDLQNLEFFHEVKKWLSTAVEGSELLLPCPETVQPYLLHYELRSEYANVWSEDSVDNEQVCYILNCTISRGYFAFKGLLRTILFNIKFL
jgi:hypothetical protein